MSVFQPTDQKKSKISFCYVLKRDETNFEVDNVSVDPRCFIIYATLHMCGIDLVISRKMTLRAGPCIGCHDVVSSRRCAICCYF